MEFDEKLVMAINNLAYQVQSGTRQLERIADIFEDERAKQEQWTPEAREYGGDE